MIKNLFKEKRLIIFDTITNHDVNLMKVSKVEHLNYDGIIIDIPNIYGKPTFKILKFFEKNKDEF